MQTVTHPDGTQYRVERRGAGRWFDTYFVYSVHGYYRVFANNVAEAITKARAQYAFEAATNRGTQ